MLLQIPTIIEQPRTAGMRDNYLVYPAFFPNICPRRGRELERVLRTYGNDLQQYLLYLLKSHESIELAQWAFAPPLKGHRPQLLIELKNDIYRPHLFVISFKLWNRTIAFAPALPDLWFEVPANTTIRNRAEAVYTEFFRQRLKQDLPGTPDQLHHAGSASIISQEIYLPDRIGVSKRKPERRPETLPNGEHELRQVGERLTWPTLANTNHALFRERELRELTTTLHQAERTAVAIIGPPRCGKTAILMEYLARQMTRRQANSNNLRRPLIKELTWHLAPARLISGMSFVGQWEARWLAILKEANKRNHILYFTEFLSLYSAGRSAHSDLSLATVLKPRLEQHELRLVVEMTSEEFRTLAERDRGMADLFRVLPIEELPEEQTLRILIRTLQDIEAKEHCQFSLDCLPTVMELTRRYLRHQAFPGKASAFLKQLAQKYRHQAINRNLVLQEFRRQTGISLAFLDREVKLPRAKVVSELEKGLVGQPTALSVAADVVSVVKARLNDPTRPLATLLLVGPTGVGKTQFAKLLTRFLFDDESKLIRFDMNEYLAPGAAARLVGTLQQPEGLLTAAIRRQPFAVLLFDEIEKADPEVFDLLLQVLGEGRLTDSMGRTADFTNCIILLTSNLGARKAAEFVGFKAHEMDQSAVYIQEAERFFRPEFFNRLDRVVPFASLRRADMQQIARIIINQVFQREGLGRRQCMLSVDPLALARVADLGYDPDLGARALKRAIERHLARPVAARLASVRPETPTLIRVYREPHAVATLVQPLTPVTPVPVLTEADLQAQPVATWLPVLSQAHQEIAERLRQFRPDREMESRRLTPLQTHYYLTRDVLEACHDQLTALQDSLADQRLAQREVHVPPPRPVRRSFNRQNADLRPGSSRSVTMRKLGGELKAAADIQDFLQQAPDSLTSNPQQPDSALMSLIHQLAFLQVLINALVQAQEHQGFLLADVAEVSPAPTNHYVSGLFSLPLGAIPTTSSLPNMVTDTEIDSQSSRSLADIVAEPETKPTPPVPPPLFTDRVLLTFSNALAQDLSILTRVSLLVREALQAFELEVTPIEVPEYRDGVQVLVAGFHAPQLALLETGIHLYQPAQGNLVPIEVRRFLLASGESPQERFRREQRCHEEWVQGLAMGTATLADQPHLPGPLIRLYSEKHTTHDYRTGLECDRLPERWQMLRFLRSALPMPLSTPNAV